MGPGQPCSNKPSGDPRWAEEMSPRDPTLSVCLLCVSTHLSLSLHNDFGNTQQRPKDDEMRARSFPKLPTSHGWEVGKLKVCHDRELHTGPGPELGFATYPLCDYEQIP